MRSFAILPITALILTAPMSAPLPAETGLAAPAAPAPARAADDPETICAPFLQQFRERNMDRVGYGRSGRRAQPAAPMPMPAPVPAPVSPGASAEEVVVTGQRIRRPDLSSTESLPMLDAGPASPRAPGSVARPENRERYAGEPVATVQSVAEVPVSTFSVDVDTGSYANVRRFLTRGTMPPQAAVRTEEMLNYFRYDYPAPQDRSRPFTVSADMTTTPWNPETRLLRVGLRGYDLPRAERPPANLVFLVDVSGSMQSPDKHPLVQCSLALVAERMGPRDRVSIVAYAGAAGLVLPATSSREKVIAALARLEAGGSTAGGEGIRLAYRTARENMIEGGVNRVILATDGDFNVGITDNETLIDMVERERASGITLTTLGYGTGNYNEAMMEQIADHGNGNYAYIDSPREAHKGARPRARIDALHHRPRRQDPGRVQPQLRLAIPSDRI
jgi:Ca-activated chloride channel family protein